MNKLACKLALLFLLSGAALGQSWYIEPNTPGYWPSRFPISLPTNYCVGAYSDWAPATSYSKGSIIRPTAGNAGNYSYIAQSIGGLSWNTGAAGVSNATAPTWPQTANSSVTDGNNAATTITWVQRADSCINMQFPIRLTSTQIAASSIAGGLDIRVTDSDGLTLLPHFVECWNGSDNCAAGTSMVWVRVPIVPAAGKTIYLYLGNATGTPTQGYLPPMASYAFSQVNASTYIIPAGDPQTSAPGKGLLPETLIQDPIDGHYYLLAISTRANFQNPVLMHSDTPTIQDSGWIWDNYITTSIQGTAQDAPHLKIIGSNCQANPSGCKVYLWYTEEAVSQNIYLSTKACDSTSCMAAGGGVNSGWTNKGVQIARNSGTWNATQVNEPYVIQRQDTGAWVLLLMGNQNGGATPDETVSYATASTPDGPWALWNAGVTPWIPNGPRSSIDGNIIADPFAYYWNGTYYIAYACSPDANPWWECWGYTTDWVTFTKMGVLQYLEPTQPYLNDNHRGELARIPVDTDPTHDLYMFAHTGGSPTASSNNYVIGLSKQPVYGYDTRLVPPGGSPGRGNCQQVFEFCDSFDDRFGSATVNVYKWKQTIAAVATASVNGNGLTLRAPSAVSSIWLQNPNAPGAFGPGFVLESYTAVNGYSAGGLRNSLLDFASTVTPNNQMQLGADSLASWSWQTQLPASHSAETAIGGTVDTAYHKFQIYASPTATFAVDGTAGSTSIAVPSGSGSGCGANYTQTVRASTCLFPTLFDYEHSTGSMVQTTKWIRVRQCGPTCAPAGDPTTTIGSLQSGSPQPPANWKGKIVVGGKVVN